MSDLTDNQFYPSAEQVWLCTRLNNAGKWACNRLTEDADFGKKKTFLSVEAYFDLGGYVNKQNCRIWGTEKRVTVWCVFWSRVIIGQFFFKNEQGEAVTVNGDPYRNLRKFSVVFF